jgi:hypothetical protein
MRLDDATTVGNGEAGRGSIEAGGLARPSQTGHEAVSRPASESLEVTHVDR